MEYKERRLSIAEQVQMMIALQDAIKDESELIAQLRAQGQHILVPPRERAVSVLSDVLDVITRCTKLVATIPAVDNRTAADVWNDDAEQGDYAPDDDEPPF